MDLFSRLAVTLIRECVQISWTKDGGRSSETGLQGLVSNHLTLLGHNGLGGERFRKRRGLTAERGGE